MISTRWLAASLPALALAAGCEKASSDAGAPKAADVSAAAAPADPGSPHAQGTAPIHAEVPPTDRRLAELVGDPETPYNPALDDALRTGGAGKDVVAIGADDRAKVVASAAGARTIDNEAYQLRLAVPAKLPKGTEGVVTLDILPKKGWHLNKEFPTKLSVTPPAGVTLTKPEQVLADATSWTESAGQFSIRFSAAEAGDKGFAGKLRFAVCTETTCDPKREELAWSVPVE